MIEAGSQPDHRAQIAGMVFGVFLLDPDLAIAEVNPAGETFVGQSTKKLVGRNLIELLEIKSERINAWIAQPDSQLIARGVEVLLSGKRKSANITVSPIPAQPGWRVVTLADSKAGKLGSHVEHQRPLKTPNILAHEIKNPLAGIRGAAQLLQRKLAASDHKLTDLIASEVDRIAALVDRMQSLGSEAQLQLGAVNLHEAVRQASDVLAAASDTALPLFEEFDPSLPPVSGHQDSLVQVLINLLSNALEASVDVASPRVEVRTRFVSGPVLSAIDMERPVRLPIELSVSDNGPGVASHLHDHIFEPFVTSKNGGQGLGLALVAKLVRDMNGRITYHRDQSLGLSQFVLHLPVAG